MAAPGTKENQCLVPKRKVTFCLKNDVIVVKMQNRRKEDLGTQDDPNEDILVSGDNLKN